VQGLGTQWTSPAGAGIFGFPGETEKDGLVTVRFLEDHVDRISYYVMGLLMVMPGSRMFRDPAQYGVTSLIFEGNPWRTPEPAWRSDQRMSVARVKQLYERLNRLEDIYEMNEYPRSAPCPPTTASATSNRGRISSSASKRRANGVIAGPRRLEGAQKLAFFLAERTGPRVLR